MEMSIIIFIFTPVMYKNTMMSEELFRTTPQENLDEFFFSDYFNCVLDGVSFKDLPNEIYVDREEVIRDFLLQCFNLRISCPEATILLTNISKNIL